MTKKFKIILALARHFELFLIHDNLYRLLPYRRRGADNLDYVYTTPERNNAGKIYLRLHYAVTVL